MYSPSVFYSKQFLIDVLKWQTFKTKLLFMNHCVAVQYMSEISRLGWAKEELWVPWSRVIVYCRRGRILPVIPLGIQNN
jgi:hypothetical protein